MPRKRNPHRGSMQFWPRSRASGMTARIRDWTPGTEAKLLGFAGYKVGMTHVIAVENRPNATAKGDEVAMAATVIECPPLKVVGIRTYHETPNGLQPAGQVLAAKPDPALSRVIPLPKQQKHTPESLKADGLADVRVLVQTSPRESGFGKKTPELFEMAVGGASPAQKLEHAKALLGKEVKAGDTFKPGQQLDAHGITKGHGFQGPVKRFGIMIRAHKSEKTKRGPGAIGPWRGPRMWKSPHAGQMGFHQRRELNKQVLKLGDNPADVNPAGGWPHYGLVKTNYLLLKGSLMGPPKRLITLLPAARPNKLVPKDPPALVMISQASKQ
jgi:large subunit ribosomal protein L3